jgi:hypothetical protein
LHRAGIAADPLLRRKLALSRHGTAAGSLLSRLALAGQRFARLGSCFVADFRRRTGNHFGEICLAVIRLEPGNPATLLRPDPAMAYDLPRNLNIYCIVLMLPIIALMSLSFAFCSSSEAHNVMNIN